MECCHLERFDHKSSVILWLRNAYEIYTLLYITPGATGIHETQSLCQVIFFENIKDTGTGTSPHTLMVRRQHEHFLLTGIRNQCRVVRTFGSE